MAVVGSVLFAFYAVAAVVVMCVFGWSPWLVLLGSVAFATGRKGAGTVVASEELLRLLDADELEGVLAHELAHVRNRDVVVMALGQGVASIVAIVAIVAQWAVLLTGDNDLADVFLALVVGQLTQLLVMVFVFAIARYREYVADSDAADAIGGGEPLARWGRSAAGASGAGSRRSTAG